MPFWFFHSDAIPPYMFGFGEVMFNQSFKFSQQNYMIVKDQPGNSVTIDVSTTMRYQVWVIAQCHGHGILILY